MSCSKCNRIQQVCGCCWGYYCDYEQCQISTRFCQKLTCVQELVYSKIQCSSRDTKSTYEEMINGPTPCVFCVKEVRVKVASTKG